MAKIILKDGSISSSAGINIDISGSTVLSIGTSSLDLQTSYVTLSELVEQPVIPAPGKGAIYVSSSDSALYYKNDLGDTYNLTVGGGASGDIEQVIAGTNLIGGGTSGVVTLNLSTNLSGLTSVQATNITSSGVISGSAAFFATTTTNLNGLKTSVSIKTTNTTLLNTEHIVLGNATAGQIVLTLPAANSVVNQQYTVKKIDSSLNKVIISGSSNETIDGADKYEIGSQYETITIVSDGISSWYLLSLYSHIIVPD